MINQDIQDGWEWLRSLTDEKWRQAINQFLETLEQSRQIPYGFSRIKELRKDVEKIYESQLSEWFCELERMPA